MPSIVTLDLQIRVIVDFKTIDTQNVQKSKICLEDKNRAHNLIES